MQFLIKLPIQSFSDIITNSSSELFAVVTAEDENVLSTIYTIINRIFGWNQETEITPTVELCDGCVEIELPYSLKEYKLFYKAGFNTLLKELFGDNFKIEYSDLD